MIALLTLATCALLPPVFRKLVDLLCAAGPEATVLARERAIVRSRLVVLRSSVVLLPASAVAGALTVDPVLSTRWPTAGSWLFATVCGITAWASLSLAQQTPEESAAMPWLETLGRSVQMAAVPALAVGCCLIAVRAVEAWVPMVPAARAVLAAGLSALGLVVVSPWLAMQLRLWRKLPIALEAGDRRWRLAHLPVPAPFLTHAAAMPWLRTVFVTDGLIRRAPTSHWYALVRYEMSSANAARPSRAVRWAIATPLALVVYVAAAAVGADDPRKLVAAMVLAVTFHGVTSWFANREPVTTLSVDPTGPTMQELAQTLRSLPPAYGQALPRTAHRPLGSAVYDRLFALGHDPGRRPHR